MRLTNTSATYGVIARCFHWLIALLILTLIPLGYIANDAPFGTDAEFARKFMLFSLHKTVGVVVFGLAACRVLWALGQPKPWPLHPDRQFETFVAAVTHWLLYSALIVVPLTGWIEHAAIPGLAPIWWPFGQSLPFVTASEALFNTASTLHRAFGKVLILAIGLHIAGVLRHQFMDRDSTLQRMWSGKAANPAGPGPGHLGPISVALLVWLAVIVLAVALAPR